MKKKQRTILTAVVASIGFLALGAYVLRGLNYQSRFLPKTEVMGVAIGGDTVESANKKLKTHFSKQEYRLVEGKQTIATIKASDLKLNDDYTKQLNSLLSKQNPWGFSAVKAAETAKSGIVGQTSTKIDAVLQPIVKTLNAKRQPARNAAVVNQDGSFVIIPEKDGTQVDLKRLTTIFSETLSNGKTTVDVSKAVQKPTIRQSDRSIQDAQKKLSKIGDINANIKIQDATETIPNETIKAALAYQDGRVTVDQNVLTAYVSQLNTKYATINKSRTFKSTKQGTVQVPAGTYGWSLNIATTTANVAQQIEKGQDFTQDATYVGVGFDKGTDIGNTYIEVDKKAQHEWFYKDGKLVMDTDIVTGKPGQDTPSGVFYVWNKERNAVLVGKDYRSPVSYWMPIDYTGVGLHDSNWQPKYGGDWWIKHGSHGCVNNPPSFMAKLFEAVPLKTPVIVIG